MILMTHTITEGDELARDKLPTVWQLEPHTRAKHELLKRYLGGWFPILSKWRGRVLFLDGFAGPGIYANGEPGSPSMALETLLNHDHLNAMDGCEFQFVFNERNADRYEHLKKVVRELERKHSGFPRNINVHLFNSSFTELAADILQDLGDRHLAPTFAFLDPFGYQDVPMALIKYLLSYPGCELFIYFDYNSVNRFATAGNVDQHFEQLYGTDEFKNAPPAGRPERKKFLHDLYEDQLSTVCGFDYVQSFEMVNSQNRTGYYLFFCTRNIKGLSKMKEAMWKIAPMGDYRFSDLLAGQPVLFEKDVDTNRLQQELLRHFRGKTVPIEEVEKYVVAHTPYCAIHVRQKTLAPMQKKGLIDSPNQLRKGTFPKGTLIRFS